MNGKITCIFEITAEKLKATGDVGVRMVTDNEHNHV